MRRINHLSTAVIISINKTDWPCHLIFFVACSQRFKKQGIRTAAFVTSNEATLGPWDVNDGLPTLEMHRYLPIEVQTKHLFATGLIDDVIIGNAYASEA